ncbi:threonine synthase [Pontibacter ummariensis]|uniref:Threonine synthase n=1 Tax=Pontibacter ummariensis TaxID=1610492 RepID=A0A239F959_9BACT|nr:threonine synthase [Pontibacter ummariensis]PRY12389.1 threonine synthase [Pontibacter ummariensis]SNS52843.1 threonine synthase [Pontibacter ummariensis]
MNFYSTNHQAPELSFKEAVIKGLPQDKGLFFPKEIPSLPASFFEALPGMDLPEIAFQVLQPFTTPDISEADLRAICAEVFTFPIPLKQVKGNIYSLELFHGPTCAFKDVGARFMSRCLQAFTTPGKPVTVLVATSGDTGSAVANGFLGVENVEVVILYPKEGVSDIQERQFTTLGQNIRAVAVEGTFDDCQHLVKQAFSDEALAKDMQLSSANSINVARWLPQMVYYFHAWGQWRKAQPQEVSDAVTFAVPSGNFGNLAAGVQAQRMGLPVRYFIAATNRNKVVPDYLETGNYTPAPSVPTIANAMDVGSPNNFPRMLELFGQDDKALKETVKGYWTDDAPIKTAIRGVNEKEDYLLDPHGAIGYLALEQYLPALQTTGIFLETAHPAKFRESIEAIVGSELALPAQLQAFLNKPKKAGSIPNDYGSFTAVLQEMANTSPAS